MYVAIGASSFGRGLWWRGRRCYGWWVWVVPAVGLEDVGWLDPVG
jgi:hypothetical protein